MVGNAKKKIMQKKQKLFLESLLMYTHTSTEHPPTLDPLTVEV